MNGGQCKNVDPNLSSSSICICTSGWVGNDCSSTAADQANKSNQFGNLLIKQQIYQIFKLIQNQLLL